MLPEFIYYSFKQAVLNIHSQCHYQLYLSFCPVTSPSTVAIINTTATTIPLHVVFTAVKMVVAQIFLIATVLICNTPHSTSILIPNELTAFYAKRSSSIFENIGIK